MASARGLERARWRRPLVDLARSGELAPAGLELALERLGILPDAARSRTFADHALLAAGTLLLLAGIVFFFAFNWSELHRYARLALVAVPLAGAALGALFALHHAARFGPLPAQAALGAAVVLIGVALAVVGQIYQTGADSELLFAGWALLALPWVIVAGAPWLWLFWLLLLNVALGLYLVGRADFWGLFNLKHAALWSPLLLNAAALALWEGLALLGRVARPAYGPRWVALFAAVAATVPALVWVFRSPSDAWPALRWSPFIYITWVLATSAFYRLRCRDLVPLALLAGSLVVVLGTWVGRQIFDTYRQDANGFLLLAVAIGGLSTAATLWLRQTGRAWAKDEAQGDAEEDA